MKICLDCIGCIVEFIEDDKTFMIILSLCKDIKNYFYGEGSSYTHNVSFFMEKVVVKKYIHNVRLSSFYKYTENDYVKLKNFDAIEISCPPDDRKILSEYTRHVTCLKLHGLGLSIYDDDLKYFSDLKILDIYNNSGRITNKGLEYIKNMSELHLSAIRTQLTDEGIENLHHIRVLSLETCYKEKITDRGLKNLTNIRYLWLHYGKNITDKGIKYISKSIRFLHLWENRSITDKGLGYAKNRIRCLHMYHNENITDKGLSYLTGIKELSLGNSDGITDKGMKYLRGLYRLDLWGNKNVTHIGLKYVEGVRHLSIEMHPTIDKKMVESMTGLKILNHNPGGSQL
jgi:hypothetical protein